MWRLAPKNRGAIWRIDFKKRRGFSGENLGQCRLFGDFSPPPPKKKKTPLDRPISTISIPKLPAKSTGIKTTPKVPKSWMSGDAPYHNQTLSKFFFVVTQRDRDRVAISGVRSFHARLQADCRFNFHYLVSYILLHLFSASLLIHSSKFSSHFFSSQSLSSLQRGEKHFRCLPSQLRLVSDQCGASYWYAQVNNLSTILLACFFFFFFSFFLFLSVFIACAVQHLEDDAKTDLEDGKEPRV